jgi:VanZ family protein
MDTMWTKFVAWHQRWPAGCRWLLPVAWMALIFCLSAQPDLPHASEPVWDLLLKKAAHMVEYGILFLLIWQALPRRRSGVVLAWMLTVLYAASDEFHQAFVPGRNGRWVDVVIDSAGALLAAFAVRMRMRRR